MPSRLTFFLFALLAFCSSSVYSSSVPAFLWGGQKYFTGADGSARSEIKEVLRQGDVFDAIPKKLASGSESAGIPEMMVAFFYSELSASDVSVLSGAYGQGSNSFKTVQDMMNAAPSSLVAPFVRVSHSFSARDVPRGSRDIPTYRSLPSVVLSAALRSAYIVPDQFGLDGKPDCDRLVTMLDESMTNLYTNGVTDIVRMRAGSPFDKDTSLACLQRVVDVVARHSNQKYVVMVSAETPSVVLPANVTGRPSHTHPTMQAMASQSFVTLATTNGTTTTTTTTTANGYPGVKYIGPDILIGVLISLMLVFTLWCGVSQLMAVQAPTRFPTQKLVLGKIDEGSK